MPREPRLWSCATAAAQKRGAEALGARGYSARGAKTDAVKLSRHHDRQIFSERLFTGRSRSLVISIGVG
jgi:hypothetical protein